MCDVALLVAIYDFKSLTSFCLTCPYVCSFCALSMPCPIHFLEHALPLPVPVPLPLPLPMPMPLWCLWAAVAGHHDDGHHEVHRPVGRRHGVVCHRPLHALPPVHRDGARARRRDRQAVELLRKVRPATHTAPSHAGCCSRPKGQARHSHRPVSRRLLLTAERSGPPLTPPRLTPAAAHGLN